MKKEMGDSCFGSPTTIACRPREITPTASHTGICDASSKMTRSNCASTSRYCATDSGDIRRHGFRRGSNLGRRRISTGTGRC